MSAPAALKPASVAAGGATATATQRQGHSHSHGGHGHSHSHGSIEKNVSGRYLRQCQLATLAGGATNVFFCVTKLWVGSAGGSVALVADGFHSLTDILADIVSYVALSLSRKKLPRCRFPFGIGRLETSGAVVVAAILFFGGVALLVQSLEQCMSDVSQLLMSAAPTGGIAAALLLSIRHALGAVTGGEAGHLAEGATHEDADTHASAHNAAHGHSHGGGDHHGHSHFEVTQYDEATGKQIILWTMVGIAAASVACKELLFRWTRRVGLRAGSRVVVANAYHHRADAWSGGVALVGVAGQVMGLPGVDGLAGLAVSLSICKIGYGILKDAVLEFFDFQSAAEVSAIREQLQQFNLRIVRGVDVVPNHSAPACATTTAAAAEATSPAAAALVSSSDEGDAVHRKRIRLINVFLVRHGHQYALHVTLLVYETVPAQHIQEATEQITALARGSLPVQDTFTSLLLCSNHTESREEFLGSAAGETDVVDENEAAAGAAGGDHDGHARAAAVDNTATAEAPPIAATGAVINPSLERCIASLQEFHTFAGRIRYNWEERTITAPSSESCECERDVESVAEIFKCRLVGGKGGCAAASSSADSGHGHAHGEHAGHAH